MDSRDVLISVVEYLLAEDDSADIADLALRAADVCGSPTLVEKVARRPNLTEAAFTRVLADNSAKVVAARLSRDGVTEAEQIKAAKDKRVSVAATVAEVMGLPQEAYESLGKHKSPKVLMPLAMNTSAPTQTRLHAAAGTLRAFASSRQYAVRREVEDMFSSLPGAADLVSEVSHLPSWMAETAAESGYMSVDGASKLLRRSLDQIAAQSKNRFVTWEMRQWSDVVKSLGQYKVSRDLRDEVSHCPHLEAGIKGEFARQQRSAHDGRVPSVVSWDRVACAADLEPYVEACIDGGSGLYTSLLAHPHLSDDQFTRIVLSKSHSWGVVRSFKVVKDNSARAAALLASTYYLQDDATLSLCTRPSEVLAHVIEIMSKYEVGHSVTRFVLKSKYFTPELAKNLPTAALRSSIGSPEVAKYLAAELREKFGDDPSAWVAVLELVSRVDTTFESAMEIAQSVLSGSDSVTAKS